MACELCEVTPSHPRFVAELEASTLIVGAHQRFPGYCVLVAKTHAREQFELPEPEQAAIARDLMRAARALQTAYAPWKINYSCYGNQVPHVHWHLFPRSESDPQRLLPPWAQSAEFDQHATTEAQALEAVERMRSALN